MPALGPAPPTFRRHGQAWRDRGVRQRRVLDALVVGEVAVAFILLCGSALLLRSLVGLINVNGVCRQQRADDAVAGPGLSTGSRYASPEEFKSYLRSIETSIDSIPGVEDTALTNALPMTNCCLYTLNLQIANRPPVDRASRGGGFFKVVSHLLPALGLTLRRGRFLDQRDRGGAVPAIVVNERLANRYFPGEDPIGQHILNPQIVPGKTERGPDISWEIVGVVANEISAPSTTTTARWSMPRTSRARCTSQPDRSGCAGTQWAGEDDSKPCSIQPGPGGIGCPHTGRTEDGVGGETLVQAEMMSTFSGVAVALAAIGIYGVLAYSVALRRRESAFARRLVRPPPGCSVPCSVGAVGDLARPVDRRGRCHRAGAAPGIRPLQRAATRSV